MFFAPVLILSFSSITLSFAAKSFTIQTPPGEHPYCLDDKHNKKTDGEQWLSTEACEGYQCTIEEGIPVIATSMCGTYHVEGNCTITAHPKMPYPECCIHTCSEDNTTADSNKHQTTATTDKHQSTVK